MKPTHLKLIYFALLLALIGFFGCERQASFPEKIGKKIASIKAESKILKGRAIQEYDAHSPNPNKLSIKYSSDGRDNEITYTADPELRIRQYLFSNRDLSFKIVIDERKKGFKLISSRNDSIDVFVSGKVFVDFETKTELPSTWFTKLKFDYALIFEMMEIITEIEAKKLFVNSITLMDQKIDEEILLKKASMSSHPVAVSYQPCSEGNKVCKGELRYAETQTLACSYSTGTLGGACSNQYCIGYCEYLGCDCICALGDYACYCTAKGRFCTGRAE